MLFSKQKTAYEMLACDWSSDVCSSDLPDHFLEAPFLDLAGCGPGSDLTLGGHGTPGLLGASPGGQAASMGTHSFVLADPVLTGPLCLAP